MRARPFFKPLVAMLLAAAAASFAFAAEPNRPHEENDNPGGGIGTLPPGLLNPDNDLGCQVMLCLASPNSPTEFAECVDPIEKLYDRLRKGRSFPQCDMGGGEDGNYARQRGDYIDVYIEGQLYTSINWRDGGGGCVGCGGGGRDQPGRPREVAR